MGLSAEPKEIGMAAQKQKPVDAPSDAGGIEDPADVELISEVRRNDRIATAAYYRAERRGFAPGGALEDWLAAEQEIENKQSGRDT